MTSLAKLERYKTRDEWLQARSNGIGGSDAAVIMGASRWKSPYALWAEKSGVADLSTEETEYQKWGRILEGPIADEYAKLTGREVIDLGEYTINRHPVIPHMACTHDRLVIDPEKGGPVPLSLKTAAQWKAVEWEGAQAPIEYEIQLQDEMAISGATWGSYAVLIWGRGVMWFDVERNDNFIRALERECGEFWRRVETGDAPDPTGGPGELDALKLMYGVESPGKVVDLSAEAAGWTHELEQLRGERALIEKRERELKARIMHEIGDAEVGVLSTGDQWTWKTQHRKGYVVEASSSRVLRPRKGKKK